MYLEILDSLNIEDLIKHEYDILAHINKEETETLKMHIDLCKKYFKKIYIDKELEKVFLNFESIFLINPNEEEQTLFGEMLLSIITMHDMGKINPDFQKEKMKNDLKIDMGLISDANHSIYSSIIYIDYYIDIVLKLIKEKKIQENNIKAFFALLILNSYIISKHHSSLNNMKSYIEEEGKLLIHFDKDKIESLKLILSGYSRKLTLNEKKIRGIIKKYKEFNQDILKRESVIESDISIYTYERFMLSILIACDYYSTSEYMSGTEINDMGTIKELDKFYNTFKSGEIYKSIREYEDKDYRKQSDFKDVENINILRNEMFLDAEQELIKNLDKNIFYLEAPTGSGKSNVANNLAFKIIEKDKSKNKIFYVYPFNTLIEQNLSTLEKIYKDNNKVLEKIAVINSLFPIKEVDRYDKDDEDEIDNCFNNEEYVDYSKSLLNRQFLNYPMILTTHVSLFSYMFGTMKENMFAFHQLANSVIILDEIQSYKNIIWREIIEFLNVFSKILNLKIIIMSATLPNLTGLLGRNSEDNSVYLIKNRDKYFKNKIFKNRVEVDYSLMNLEKQDVFNELIKEIKGNIGKKIIVEFISRNSAYNFFKELKSKEELGEIPSEIRLLTGDDNSIERKKIIEEIKELDDIILVATQVIEAGVDIDMDIGFKDSSILDSEEQFLGRINRSCLKEDSVVYFFNLDEAANIYTDDIRKQSRLTLGDEEIRGILKEKEFDKYNELVNEKLIENTSGYNDSNTEEFFKDIVGKLNFKQIKEKMKLIDDKQNDISIFLAYEIKVEDKETGNLEKIDGKEVWNEYRKLLLNNELDYAKKIVELSKVKSKMSYFIYRIRTKESFNYNERIGELLYIENGDDFFENGKLNKAMFERDIGEFI